jgi:hypothetical protein
LKIREQLYHAARRRSQHRQPVRVADQRPAYLSRVQRPEGFQIDRGTVSGLGDVSLLLKTVLFHYASPARRSFEFEDKTPIAVEHEPDFTVSAFLLTGIKFPTGDSSRLEEEFHEVEIPGAPESGIHGHDLTLGTGSYDGIFGQQMAMRYKNVFFDTNVRFTLRGDGTHQYHFANDLVWSGGPGYYIVRNRDTIFGVQCVVSGEYKDVDRFRGKKAEDTGITSVFLGPRLVASRGRWRGGARCFSCSPGARRRVLRLAATAEFRAVLAPLTSIHQSVSGRPDAPGRVVAPSRPGDQAAARAFALRLMSWYDANAKAISAAFGGGD